MVRARYQVAALRTSPPHRPSRTDSTTLWCLPVRPAQTSGWQFTTDRAGGAARSKRAARRCGDGWRAPTSILHSLRLQYPLPGRRFDLDSLLPPSRCRRRHFLQFRRSSGAFAALSGAGGARMGGGAIRTSVATCATASGYAPRAVAPPLRGAPSLARSRGFCSPAAG